MLPPDDLALRKVVKVPEKTGAILCKANSQTMMMNLVVKIVY